jgi:hypothetical protein
MNFFCGLKEAGIMEGIIAASSDGCAFQVTSGQRPATREDEKAESIADLILRESTLSVCGGRKGEDSASC